MENNDFKWVKNVKNLDNDDVLTIIKAIQRRLDKDIDKDEVQEGMALKQEVLIMEAEKRGLEI